MFGPLSILYSFSFLLVCVFAQTLTVADPAGSTNSVVEVVSVDPDTGDTTTSIISTIIPTTVATTTPPADVPGDQQGPVGAPPNTATVTGPPQIVYTFTTSDAAGDRQVITTTFTPTYQTPNPTSPLSSGTIWGFSDYTQQFGAATTHGSANSLMASRPSSPMWAVACGIVAIGAGGMLLI